MAFCSFTTEPMLCKLSAAALTISGLVATKDTCFPFSRKRCGQLGLDKSGADMAFGGDPVGEWAAAKSLPRGLHAMQATTATANAKPELIEWLGPLWYKNFVDNGSTPLANTLNEVR